MRNKSRLLLAVCLVILAAGLLAVQWTIGKETWRNINREYYAEGCAVGIVLFGCVTPWYYRAWRESRRAGVAPVGLLLSFLTFLLLTLVYAGLLAAHLTGLLTAEALYPPLPS